MRNFPLRLRIHLKINSRSIEQQKNGDYRAFYVISSLSLNDFLDNFLFKQKNKKYLNEIFDLVCDNDYNLNSSIIRNEKGEYYFRYFNEINYNKNAELIQHKMLMAKNVIDTDLTNMYESTYLHSISWSYKGKDEYKKYFSDKKIFK